MDEVQEHRRCSNRGVRAVLVAVLAFSLTAAACGGEEETADKPDKVRVAIILGDPHPSIIRAAGWFEDALEGVIVEWTPFDSGADVIRALGTGEMDLGVLGQSPLSSGLGSGLGAQLIYLNSVIGTSEGIAVKPESGISSIEDLQGKTVGVPFGSTPHWALFSVLAKRGLDPATDVDIIDLAPGDAPAAWQTADIDAAWVWEPPLLELVDMGAEVIFTAEDSAAEGFPELAVSIANPDFAATFPSVVETFVAQLDRVTRLVQEDRDEATRLLAQDLELPEEDAAHLLEGFIYVNSEEQLTSEWLGTSENPGALADVLKSTNDFLAEQGVAEQAADPSIFADAIHPEYLEAVLG